MRLAVGVITWQDGADNLVDAWESCELADPDLILLCDGVIDGVDQGGLPDMSDLPSTIDGYGISFLNDRPVTVRVESHRWSSQSAKRSWLLDTARTHGCDWLLQIDADERLHNAHLLRPFLDGWPADAFPVPFEVDPGVMLGATWKCLRVNAWRKVVSGGAYIEHRDGTVYCVTPPGNAAPGVERFDNLEQYRQIAPWLSHHPELRPEGRRAIRLGEVEHILEPPPHVEGYLTPSLAARPVLASPAVTDQADGTATDSIHDGAPAAEWACTQCGARYSSPGICEAGHPATAVIAVSDTPAEDVEPSALDPVASDPVASPDAPIAGAADETAPADGAATPATVPDLQAKIDNLRGTGGAVSLTTEPAPAELTAGSNVDAQPTPYQQALVALDEAAAAIAAAVAAIQTLGG